MAARSFIETQFPVSLLSKESYKERKAGSGQTLTGLGKWWGRKPLVLVRATILGLLIPASASPEKDRDAFLRLMTMDEDGLWRRKDKAVPQSVMFEALSDADRKQHFGTDSKGKHVLLPSTTKEVKAALERKAFFRLPYEKRLDYCKRPEQIDGPSPESWTVINAHFGTSAATLQEFVEQMGQRQFGHTPRVGDAFCGGGSVPFEAARLGCEAFGNDLNPVAALLTWGALNLVGGGPDVAKQVAEEQKRVLAAVDKQITDWGIEHDSKGRRADAYLYLTETRCPSCQWTVPMAPSFVIGEKTKTVAQLREDVKGKRYHIDVVSGVSASEMTVAKKGTVAKGRLSCPHCETTHAVSDLRGDRTITTTVVENGRERTRREQAYGLRLWENDDVVPRPTDVFQERLYCVRWVEVSPDGQAGKRVYESVTGEDLAREAKVLVLLKERFAEWQEKGFIPSRRIQPGDKTNEPIRTRGWTHWHHLFNPRQLLLKGLYAATTGLINVAHLLNTGRLANWDSRLSIWDCNVQANMQVFNNQSLNPLFNHAAKGFKNAALLASAGRNISHLLRGEVCIGDSRVLSHSSDFWLTDPPYADAVNYDELSEFFLAWYDKHLTKLFPGWYSDSKRQLAARGSDAPFRQTMVDIYKNLADHMPDNGAQVVMFTHQDAEVWADLGLILWAAGLRVTAAWTIATETTSGLKDGNYVSGTVFLVLRKNLSAETGYPDEILEDIEHYVPARLSDMQAHDKRSEPDFVDADYNLAAYAAALEAVTGKRKISGVDAHRTLFDPRPRGWVHPFKRFIDAALSASVRFLVPTALGESDAERKRLWNSLTAEERFYLKGLDAESRGILTQSTYQEFARVYGVTEYLDMVAATQANAYRLKNPTEFRRTGGGRVFGDSVTRQVLHAIRMVADAEDVEEGIRHLKSSLGVAGFWSNRELIIGLLRFMRQLPQPTWQSAQPWVEVLYQNMSVADGERAA